MEYFAGHPPANGKNAERVKQQAKVRSQRHRIGTKSWHHRPIAENP
jgi:hypothetical protein